MSRFLNILIVLGTMVITIASLWKSSIAERTFHKSGLEMGKNLDVVLENCTGCHAADIIVQNRMTREQWNKTLTWMQKTQGMRKVNPKDRRLILDYLEHHQGPDPSNADSKENGKPSRPGMYEYDYPPNPL